MSEGPFFVTYKLAGQPRKVATPDHEQWTLSMIETGFWITQQHAMCQERQGHYWIPPSQIVLVEKRNVPPTEALLT